jgi:hypothetical protein
MRVSIYSPLLKGVLDLGKEVVTCRSVGCQPINGSIKYTGYHTSAFEVLVLSNLREHHKSKQPSSSKIPYQPKMQLGTITASVVISYL